MPKNEHKSPSIMLKIRQNNKNTIQPSNSKIPVKTRQVSVPIEPIDDSLLGNVKRSSIPRITSSPLISTSLERKTLTPIINKELNISTPKSNKGQGKLPTPPSTLTKLAHQLSSLSLDSPVRKKTRIKPFHEKVETRTPEVVVQRNSSPTKREKEESTHHSSTQINTKDKDDSRIRTSNSCLGSRTSTLLKSRVQNHDIPSDSPLSPSKNQRVLSNSSNSRFASGSVPRNISVHKTRSAPKQNSQQPIRPKMKVLPDTRDSSPLVERLTRSTTASNLKSSAKLPRSSTMADLNTKIRSVSNVTMTTRKHSTSSRIVSNNIPAVTETKSAKVKLGKPESINQNDSPTTLTIPKRRTNMKKSFSVNVGLKDFTKADNKPLPIHSNRLPSYQRPSYISTSKAVSSLSGKNQKVVELDQLKDCLLNFDKTNAILNPSNIDKIRRRKPQCADQVIAKNSMTFYERAEVLKNKEIYFIGHRNSHNSNFRDFRGNFGFDDKDKNLIVEVGSHIKYRYEVVAKLGKGVFGNVMKCYDHKTGRAVSVKIMKNDISWSLQCINEIKILKNMKHDNLLRYFEHFNFRSHICISTELLGVNLFEALEASKFNGFDIPIIKKWAKDILSGLNFIHSEGIVHADLKPENIMLVSPNSLDIKIIDFGSSSAIGDVSYSYIQSRYYRAPEILLGCRYTEKIDVWSFASLLFELFKGDPLFGAKDENHLFTLIVKAIGMPKCEAVISMRNDVINYGSINKKRDPKFVDKRALIFTKFDEKGKYKGLKIDQNSTERNDFKDLKTSHPQFYEFLNTALIWNYKERPSAFDLLDHEFLL